MVSSTVCFLTAQRKQVKMFLCGCKWREVRNRIIKTFFVQQPLLILGLVFQDNLHHLSENNNNEHFELFPWVRHNADYFDELSHLILVKTLRRWFCCMVPRLNMKAGKQSGSLDSGHWGQHSLSARCLSISTTAAATASIHHHGCCHKPNPTLTELQAIL